MTEVRVNRYEDFSKSPQVGMAEIFLNRGLDITKAVCFSALILGGVGSSRFLGIDPMAAFLATYGAIHLANSGINDGQEYDQWCREILAPNL